MSVDAVRKRARLYMRTPGPSEHIYEDARTIYIYHPHHDARIDAPSLPRESLGGDRDQGTQRGVRDPRTPRVYS